MNFNSIEYVVFIIIVFIVYWSIPKTKYRNIVLLGASYFFYMSWNIDLVGIILGITGVSYVTARLLSFVNNVKYRKLCLIVGTGLSIVVLFVFKYLNFMGSTLAQIFNGGEFSPLNIILPVGISFYTFQTLSYVIDVYYNKIESEKNFFTYALYVSFFPQLVAGPIERPEHFIPQLKEKHIFQYEEAVYGAKQIALGAFKKIVIADTVAIYVNLIYNNISQYQGFSLLFATLLFAIQIYCDFSGYSDIALGSAKLLGFDLINNFNAPYFAENRKDFWARWHISLSSWFRDYVYIPLGGSRVTFSRMLLNLLLTFLLSGLWHGANWTFVFWGRLSEN